MTYCGITALCIASHGNNQTKPVHRTVTLLSRRMNRRSVCYIPHCELSCVVSCCRWS